MHRLAQIDLKWKGGQGFVGTKWEEDMGKTVAQRSSGINAQEKKDLSLRMRKRPPSKISAEDELGEIKTSLKRKREALKKYWGGGCGFVSQ